MLNFDNYIVFGKVKMYSSHNIAALVAVPKTHFGPQTSDKEKTYYFTGLMDQAMQYNPVLSLLDTWDWLENSWTLEDVRSHTLVVL